eukprot:78636-Prymnesium_polylepis.5
MTECTHSVSPASKPSSAAVGATVRIEMKPGDCRGQGTSKAPEPCDPTLRTTRGALVRTSRIALCISFCQISSVRSGRRSRSAITRLKTFPTHVVVDTDRNRALLVRVGPQIITRYLPHDLLGIGRHVVAVRACVAARAAGERAGRLEHLFGAHLALEQRGVRAPASRHDEAPVLKNGRPQWRHRAYRRASSRASARLRRRRSAAGGGAGGGGLKQPQPTFRHEQTLDAATRKQLEHPWPLWTVITIGGCFSHSASDKLPSGSAMSSSEKA